MSVTTVFVSTVVVAIVVSVVMFVRTRVRTDKRTADSGHGADSGQRTADSVRTDSGHGSDRARTLAMYVAVLAGVFTTMLTVAAFVLSYAHLENVAVANGVPSGFLAWMWPGTIDTFIVVGELLILFAAILGLGFAWWGWGLTVGGSATSIAFNVAGVGGDARVMEYAVAAAPPVAALFAFGALMHQVRRYVATYVVTDTVSEADTTADRMSEALSEALSALSEPVSTVSAPVLLHPDVETVSVSAPVRPTVRPDKPADSVSAPVSAVRPDIVRSGHADKVSAVVSTRVRTDNGHADKVSAVVSALSERPDMTGRDVADMFGGMSGRTGQRLLASARKAVAA